MKKALLALLFFTGVFVLNGCSRDELITEPPVFVTSKEGVYVLSEGSGAAGSAKLSFLNLTDNTFSENIFSPGNIGLFPDGLIYSDREIYLTEQGNFGSAGIVYRLDSNGNVLKSASAGTNPYSLAASNGKLFITNGPSGKVSVVNKTNLNLINIISAGVYPQEIIAIGNKIFVANTGTFGGDPDSTISVINAVNDQVIAVIKVRQRPSSLAMTNDGKLLAGCPGNASEGMIFKIDPQSYSVLDSFFINNGSASGFDKDLAVDKNSSNVFFISNTNNIVKLDLNTKVHSTVIANPNPASSFYYGYNYDSNTGKHFVADARNFAVNGNLLVYDQNGSLTNSFITGIAPRRIVVK